MSQYSVFLTLAPIAMAVVILTARYAWLRPASPLAHVLVGYLLAVAAFLAANIGELISGAAGAEFFTRVQYLFIPLVPVLWMRFSLLYVGHTEWASPRRMWPFFLLPVITILLAWSNSYHGLLWQDYEIKLLGGGLHIFSVQTYGHWFWVLGAYHYALLALGAGLIASTALRAPRLFRAQSLMMISGAILPLAFNVIYVFRLVPGLSKDYTPLALAFAGLTFAVSIFRNRLFSISPVARAVLIESMQDPMLVLDEQQRVVDMNPAALRFLGVSTADSLGQPFSQVWPDAANITPLAPDATRPLGWDGAQHLARRIPPIITVTDSSQPGEPVLRSYELHISPLPVAGAGSAATGSLVVLHDLTLRRQAEQALEEANRALVEAYREVAEKSDALAKTNDSLLLLNEELEARVEARTESLRQRAAELEALARVSSRLRLATSFDELLNTLLSETAAALGFGCGAVLLYEDDNLRVAAVHNRPEELCNNLYPPGSGPLWQALQSGRLQRFDPRDGHNAAKMLLNLAGGYPRGIVAPMQAAGHSLGLLVFFYDPHEPAQEWLLAAVTEMGANAIQRVRLMETLEQLVWDRTRDMATLYDVTSTTNEYQDLDTVLVRILEKALDVLHGRVGLVHLLVERADPRYTLDDQPRPPIISLNLVTALGLDALPPSPDGLPGAAALLLGRDHPGPWSTVFERNNILVLPDIIDLAGKDLAPRVVDERSVAVLKENWESLTVTDGAAAGALGSYLETSAASSTLPAELCDLLRQRSAPAYVGVPIHAKGRALGVMSVFGESLASFSAEDIALLAAIADHVGGAVENAQLRQKAEDAAVTEERQRLARDLHDSVTQSLYSMVLFAEAGRDALDPQVLAEDGEADSVGASHNVERARKMFSRLSDTSQQALKELRLLIYELRPLALLTEGLSGALRNRLELVEKRSGMRTQLLVEHARELPPAMETGLYGIVQEALNNVLKHAHASQVTVRFEVWPDRVELEVSDNGRGFFINPDEPGGGFGLASMRERAAALGGTLAVRSEIERGTSILVSLKWEAPDEGINSSGRE